MKLHSNTLKFIDYYFDWERETFKIMNGTEFTGKTIDNIYLVAKLPKTDIRWKIRFPDDEGEFFAAVKKAAKEINLKEEFRQDYGDNWPYLSNPGHLWSDELWKRRTLRKFAKELQLHYKFFA